MGIFAKKTKDEKELKLENLIKTLTANPATYVRFLGERLSRLTKSPESAIMQPVTLYADVVEMLMLNKVNFDPKDYESALNYGETIYKEIFVYEDDTPNFDELETIFIELFDTNSVVYKRSFNPAFFNLFTNKHNYVKWARSVGPYKDVSSYAQFYIPYAATARSYYSDEDMFTSNIIGFSIKLFISPDPKLVYDEELKKLEHLAGIYNVDEARILTAEQRLDAAEALIVKSTDVLNLADDRIKAIDGVTKESYEKIKKLCEAEISSVKAELGAFDQDLQRKLDEYTEDQKKVILFEKQEFMKGIFQEAEGKINDMKRMSQMVVNSANLELMRINQESGDVITKLDNYIQDDDRVQQLLSDASSSKNLMTKLDKIMLLNDQNIDQISQSMEGKILASVQANMPQETVVKTVTVDGGVDNSFDDDVIPRANVYLDESISFKDRYDRIMERKAQLLEQGEHFHEMFDDVLVAVLENANPYLIGPTGCGKTFLVGQIARLLDMDFIDIGYINEEYDILGFQTANGGYSKPNFYRCYKYGKIAFCDELDNGNSRATVKLNSFLSNTSNACYSFPNGENVQRHPSFRMIAAGNTVGNGADSNYNTREKIEESVQQRLMPIFVGYDNSVEQKILGPYADWYQFVVLFRAATDSWGKTNYGDAPGIITTRDVARIRKYLDNGSFSADKIIDYEFIQTKDDSYLAYLSNFMINNSKENSPVGPFVKAFAKKVDYIRNSR